MFLDVVEGQEALTQFHNRLYQGILAPFYPNFLQWKSYSPHITIGRIFDEAKLDQVVDEFREINDIFEDIVREVSVEIIGEDESSMIEMTVGLMKETD